MLGEKMMIGIRPDSLTCTPLVFAQTLQHLAHIQDGFHTFQLAHHYSKELIKGEKIDVVIIGQTSIHSFIDGSRGGAQVLDKNVYSNPEEMGAGWASGLAMPSN